MQLKVLHTYRIKMAIKYIKADKGTQSKNSQNIKWILKNKMESKIFIHSLSVTSSPLLANPS